MITAALFVVLAGAGALARTEAGHRWNRYGGFPLGTLVTNVAASFCLGLLWNVTGPEATIVGAGGLGTLSTYSSFARDTVALVELRQAAMAVLYVLATCGAGVLAAAGGVAIVT